MKSNRARLAGVFRFDWVDPPRAVKRATALVQSAKNSERRHVAHFQKVIGGKDKVTLHKMREPSEKTDGRGRQVDRTVTAQFLDLVVFRRDGPNPTLQVELLPSRRSDGFRARRSKDAELTGSSRKAVDVMNFLDETGNLLDGAGCMVLAGFEMLLEAV